jgi:hypothetical protein
MSSLFGYSIEQILRCLFDCQKMAFAFEFQHTPLWKYIFSNDPHLL